VLIACRAEFATFATRGPPRREQDNSDKKCAHADSRDTRESFTPAAFVYSVHAITVRLLSRA
jgi:hypothetical protein